MEADFFLTLYAINNLEFIYLYIIDIIKRVHDWKLFSPVWTFSKYLFWAIVVKPLTVEAEHIFLCVLSRKQFRGSICVLWKPIFVEKGHT